MGKCILSIWLASIYAIVYRLKLNSNIAFHIPSYYYIDSKYKRKLGQQKFMYLVKILNNIHQFLLIIFFLLIFKIESSSV
jgi:hypothetical protein